MDSAAKWQKFQNTHQLTSHQLEQFQQYYELLIKWNNNINLTTITTLDDVIAYHFEDSLLLGSCNTMSSLGMLADIGTGAGLPGIPLKIKYPALKVVLVEVLQKKRDFLQHIVDSLSLSDVVISGLDWRNFLRQTDYPLDMVCARASLRPDELIRMFQPASPYSKAQLVYWATADWQPTAKENTFFERDYTYTVGDRIRKYMFFKKK